MWLQWKHHYGTLQSLEGFSKMLHVVSKMLPMRLMCSTKIPYLLQRWSLFSNMQKCYPLASMNSFKFCQIPLSYGFLNLVTVTASPGWGCIICWNSGYFFQCIHSSVLILKHTQYMCHARNTACHSTCRMENIIVLVANVSVQPTFPPLVSSVRDVVAIWDAPTM